MKRQIWLAGILGLATACGGKDESKPEDAPEAVAAAQAQAKRDAAEAKRVAAEREQQRRAKAEELARRKEELTAKVKQLQQALAEMDKRQAAELEGIADPRELRPYLQRLMRDSSTESARLQSMERRLAKLEKTMAKAKVSGELKVLQDRMATVEASYWKAHSGWMASLESRSAIVRATRRSRRSSGSWTCCARSATSGCARRRWRGAGRSAGARRRSSTRGFGPGSTSSPPGSRS